VYSCSIILEWLVYSSSIILEWLVHSSSIILKWLVYSFSIILKWLVYNSSIILEWLVIKWLNSYLMIQKHMNNCSFQFRQEISIQPYLYVSCSLPHVIHTDSTQYKQLQSSILSITSHHANAWVYIWVLFKSNIPVPLKFFTRAFPMMTELPHAEKYNGI
jgi:hypothetical protein